MEWSPAIIDIREHYPLLALDETLIIAQRLSFKHPTYSRARTPAVIVTDFLLTREQQDRRVEQARQLMYAKELNSQKTLERLEIERRYWEAKGVEWGVVTEHEIPLTHAKIQHFLHGRRQRQDITSCVPENHISPSAHLLTQLVMSEKHQSLCNLAIECDARLGFEPGTSLPVAYYLLAIRHWQIDMNIQIDPVKPLALRSTSSFPSSLFLVQLLNCSIPVLHKK